MDIARNENTLDSPRIITPDCGSINMLQASSLLSQEIIDFPLPLNLTRVDIQMGTAITFDMDTSTFEINQSGIYQITFKCNVIKTNLATPDVGLLVVQDGNLILFDTNVRYVIGRVATISLVNTSFIEVEAPAKLQLVSGAMYTSYSSCFMTVLKLC